MNRYKKNTPAVVLSYVLITIFSSCTKDFEQININPNEPSTAVTSALLTAAQTGLVTQGTTIGQGTVLTVSYPALYVQQLADKQYTETSRYSTTSFNYGIIYATPLDNLQTIIRINTDPVTAVDAAKNGSNANQLAVARILKAYYFLHITDRFGDIPYFDALKRTENFTPEFDAQKDIYTDLFKELKEAVAQMDGGAPVTGDILFGGDMDQWKLFANTIRLVMALRISNADPATGRAEFNSAQAAGVISNNSENIFYTFLADQNNDNPWEDAFETRLDHCVSDVFVNALLVINDPRIRVFANPAVATGTYVGMPYGITEAAAGAIPNSSVSFLGNAMRQQTSPSYIYTYAQILFSLAEAAQLGWIPGGDAAAASYYNDAIKASWEQWDVYDATAYTAYIANPAVTYTAAKYKELIGFQKWIALFLQGYEAWAEWRRLGYPALTPAPASLNAGGGIPVRQAYPAFEATLNTVNYNRVVSESLQGTDDLNGHVWWDQ